MEYIRPPHKGTNEFPSMVPGTNRVRKGLCRLALRYHNGFALVGRLDYDQAGASGSSGAVNSATATTSPRLSRTGASAVA
jgi:hypothetical protein